ncbi:MAG: hypothetical protein LBJ00_09490 [Planctomycetaceae bacterium]|nr:hypothetical protein [Planctomycetaceae bacterium]
MTYSQQHRRFLVGGLFCIWKYIFTVIPKPLWAVGFTLEQPLHVVALACSAFGILKQLEHIC